VYSYGIAALAGFASLLIIVFQAETTALIPLYAIGVFLSFTISQTGMAVRWWKSGHLKEEEVIVEKGSTVRHDPKWKQKLALNGFGGALTFVVMIVFAVTKFRDGAWIVVLLIPSLVLIFFRIHRHYGIVAKNLSLDSYGENHRILRNRVVILIGGVHRGVLHALRFARSLSDDVTAVYVAIDPAETEKIKEKWQYWGNGVRLQIIDSPYRRLLEPLKGYIDHMASLTQKNQMLTVVVPHFIPEHRAYNLLHMNTAELLRKSLIQKSDVVIMEVPYHLDENLYF
jgi:hypothetical protein